MAIVKEMDTAKLVQILDEPAFYIALISLGFSFHL